MSRHTVARRVGLGLLVLVLVLAVVATIAGVSAVRRPFPQSSGEVTVPGMTGEVTVLRDDRGIPQIYGDSVADIARAQGFVHAQDRFFEMDLRRHTTSGRLAELVGPAGLETDKVIRTMGWRRVAEAELPTLAPETRQYLQAYADGVNAYLRGRSPSSVSLEYTVLSLSLPDYQIEDWTPADSVAWLKALAWDLRGDYDDELARARLTGRLPRAQIDELYPPQDLETYQPILSRQDWSPGRQPSPVGSAVPEALRAEDPRAEDPRAEDPRAGDSAAVTSSAADRAYAAVHRALAAVPRSVGRGDGVGSNSWVVAGNRSTTGKPLLANDPHLATGIPGIWYQVGLHCRKQSPSCPLDVSGFSFSGVPGVIIGHNASIAWGMTNLNPDVSDFYLEKVNGKDEYLRDGRWTRMETRTETIKVAGGADEQITVRSTVHGPVMSDAVASIADAGARAPTADKQAGEESYAVSLAWTGLIPSKTADAILALNTASDFDAFRKAAAKFAVPSQNLVYADTEGHIGYQAPGLVPVRRAALPGTPPGYWPAPGWDSSYDWKGFVPFGAMPSVLDPEEGMLVAANQAVTASPTPFLTTEWDYGMRSQRIRQRLGALEKVSPADMASIQMDTVNIFAPTLVAALMEIDLDDDQFTAEARDLLETWDFTTPSDDSDESAAAAYYNAVWSNLLRLLFNDELPTDLQLPGGSRQRQAVAVLLETPKSAWWDNQQTPNVTEGRNEILRQALVEARLELTRKLSKDPAKWEWGMLHRLTLEHAVMGAGSVPGPVRWAFNRGGEGMPGDSAVVDANGWDASEGYDVVWAPSMRMVVDLGDLDDSTWINQTGASGHAFSSNYDDQLADWVDGTQRPWPFTRAAVDEATEDTLSLRPGRER